MVILFEFKDILIIQNYMTIKRVPDKKKVGKLYVDWAGERL